MKDHEERDNAGKSGPWCTFERLRGSYSSILPGFYMNLRFYAFIPPAGNQ
jgi:hypothetical protein